MAATIGLVQYDIKRVLAYSTVSQLGYMFLAMGVGAYATAHGWTHIGLAAFAAGAFHLMTHAFFKALLFLGSGSVIHAMAGEQDMRKMGDLKRYMPVTYVTMMIGTLAIAGIFPLAGFFSKDEILFRAFLTNKIIWGFGVITALMTAFYMFRLMSLTFYGAYRGPAWTHAVHPVGVAAHAHTLDVREAAAHGVRHPGDMAAHGQAHKDDHEVTHGKADSGSRIADHGDWHGPHESPGAMTVPLMALAVGAIVAGFVGIPEVLGGNNALGTFLEPSFEGVSHEAHHISHAMELVLMAFSVAIGVLGIFLAYRFYVRDPSISERLAARFAGAHRVLTNKYYVDEAYDATIVEPIRVISQEGLWRGFDVRVVDGAVNGVGSIVTGGAWTLRRLQSGSVRAYAGSLFVGVVLVLGYYLWR
jgi:NADH-quinone oxidoreductase subunit L